MSAPSTAGLRLGAPTPDTQAPADRAWAHAGAAARGSRDARDRAWELAFAAAGATAWMPQLPLPPLKVPQAAPPASGQAPRLASVHAGAKAPPVRLHAQWAAAGVRLWLALDAPALPDSRAIVAQVQCALARQGVRVLSFACNGRALSPLIQSKEASWP